MRFCAVGLREGSTRLRPRLGEDAELAAEDDPDEVERGRDWIDRLKTFASLLDDIEGEDPAGAAYSGAQIDHTVIGPTP